jgi:aryl-alcohol dehydrogenase-like predicted oxidoreductase
MGINVIDTAAMYGDSEEKIGRALRGRRSQCFLCTKCGRYPPRRRSILGLYERAHWQAQRLMRRVDEHESFDWQPRILEWNIDQSLRRLRVDCIDVSYAISATAAMDSRRSMRFSAASLTSWRPRSTSPIRKH